MRGVLESLVIDTVSDHNTQDTARRVAKMYLNEVFRGRYVPAPPVTEFPNAEHLNELMIVGPITVRSACSHHFCPILGRLWIGIMPNEHSNLIGLSKYSRLAEWIMGRPQIQEEAIAQMADLLMNKVSPDGLAVVMEADHFCMHWRGVKDDRTKMVNSVMRGSFLKDPHAAPRIPLPHRPDRPEATMLVRLLYASRAAAPLDASDAGFHPRAVARAQSRGSASPASSASATTCSSRSSKAAGTRSASCTTRSCATPATATSASSSFEEIRERRFGSWTMGQVNLAKVNPSLLLKYGETADLNPFESSGQATLALLDELIATALVASRG